MHNESQEEVDRTLRHLADRNSLNDQILTLRRRNSALQADYERAMDALAKAQVNIEELRRQRNEEYRETARSRALLSDHGIVGQE